MDTISWLFVPFTLQTNPTPQEAVAPKFAIVTSYVSKKQHRRGTPEGSLGRRFAQTIADQKSKRLHVFEFNLSIRPFGVHLRPDFL
jgi:hypothetical protein